jgi:hypothetical protein
MADGREERLTRVTARRRMSVGAAIACFTLVTFGPLVPQYTAQPASRYALTAALADHHTISLQRYDRVLGLDHALYRGQLRSDKAIGQPLLDVPVYLAGRALGAEPAAHRRLKANLGMWWSTLWSSLVPFILLVVLMYRFARRFVPDQALPAALALGFATMMLPHAVNLYGHVLAALFAFAALVVVEHPAPSTRRLVAAGALAGLAVAVEYHAVIAAVVVFLAVALRERRRSLWMLAGASLPALVIGWYQGRAFGAWWHTPFAYYAGQINGTTKGGYTLPGWRNINDVFAGTRGLLYVSPIVLVALGAAIWLARTTSGGIRRQAVIGLAVTAVYLVLCAGWSGTPLLEEPGPRYAIPALPFLVVPLAVVWSRWRRVATYATVIGATFMVAAASTFILLPVGSTPLTYVRYAVHRSFATNLWAMALGPAGVICYVATVAWSVRLLVRAARPEPVREPEQVVVA